MWFRVCLLGLCITDGTQAAYNPEDPFKLNANVNYQYDSNFFKLAENSSNAQVDRHGKRSESKLEAKLGGRLDLKLSRQLVSLTADINQINYANFKELNHSEWNSGLTWSWVVGSLLSGQLNASTSTRMSSFEDRILDGVDNSALDMQRQNSLDFQAVLKLKSTVDLIATVGVSTEEHDFKNYINAKSTTTSIATRYRSEQGNYISARYSRRKYTYDLDLPFRSGFTEQVGSIDMGYSPSSKIDISLNLGLSRWVSEFNGQSQTTPQGGMGLSWRATDKTSFKLAYGQNFSEFTSGVGRNLDRHYGVSTKWLMTEKTAWDFDFNRRERSLEVAGRGGVNDEDTNNARLGFTYKILPTVSIGSYIQAEQRRSNNIGSNYKDYQLGLNAGGDY
jgi:hypothetical protein